MRLDDETDIGRGLFVRDPFLVRRKNDSAVDVISRGAGHGENDIVRLICLAACLTVRLLEFGLC